MLKIRKKTKPLIKNDTSDKLNMEHKTGRLAVLLSELSKFEYRRISNGKRVPFGASCLVVAQNTRSWCDEHNIHIV